MYASCVACFIQNGKCFEGKLVAQTLTQETGRKITENEMPPMKGRLSSSLINQTS